MESQNNNMPVTTYAPRRKSSLSHITTEEVSMDIEKPKQCYRCERRQRLSETQTCRRRSSGCNSLLGSMRESLLHGKTSGRQSKPIKFKAMISAGFATPVLMDFDASFYTWEDGNESPYVGSIDMSGKKLDKAGFPGYKVDERGKIQVVICNSEESAIKIILVNYNIRKLKSGYRVFIRQSNENYTIHLNFMNCKGKFYLYDDIKVIFNNHVLSANSRDVKIAGKPSKVDLSYYLSKCYLCDPHQYAIMTDDESNKSSSSSTMSKVTEKLSSLEVNKESPSGYNEKEHEMEIKFNENFQMEYINDNTFNDQIVNEEIMNKKRENIGFNYGNHGSGMLVCGSTEFR